MRTGTQGSARPSGAEAGRRAAGELEAAVLAGLSGADEELLRRVLGGGAPGRG